MFRLSQSFRFRIARFSFCERLSVSVAWVIVVVFDWMFLFLFCDVWFHVDGFLDPSFGWSPTGTLGPHVIQKTRAAGKAAGRMKSC